MAVGVVLMFLYAEGVPIPRRRLWWQLLQKGNFPVALVECLVNLPAKASRGDLPHPLDTIRGTAAAARVLIDSLNLLPQEEVVVLVANPWRFIVEGEEIAEGETRLELWQDGALRPVLEFAQSDLLDADVVRGIQRILEFRRKNPDD